MKNLKVSRRTLLKAGAVATATALVPSVNLLAGGGEDVPKGAYPKTETFQTWCEMCFWGCGVTAHVVDGKVRKLEGQKKCPVNYGKLCAKGNSGLYQLYDPERLQYPMIRTGARGEGKFRRATWEEAIQYIADKLKPLFEQYGEKTASLICHGSGEHAFIGLMEILGSENIAIPAYSQCIGSREIGWFLTYGAPVTGKEPFDGDNAKCMMFVGRNVLEALHVGEASSVVKGLAKGAKLIYVDPRYTKTSAKADIWMKIRPGTDIALLLGMINMMVTQDLYDKAFVDQYCDGFAEMAERVTDYTVAWASETTGIPAEMIEEAVLLLVKAAPHSFVHPGRRLTRYGNDVQVTRAIAILNALLGNWEMPGGIYGQSAMSVKTPALCDAELGGNGHNFERADGAGTTWPLAPKNLGLANRLVDAIIEQKPYPVKAMFIYGTNMFHNTPDFDVSKKAIDNLDLVVACEIYMTESALYSDVILPESTYLERKEPIVVNKGMYPYVAMREPAVPPVYDTKGAWEIADMIATAMGHPNRFKPIDEFNKEVLDQLGITMDDLRKEGVFVGDGQPFKRAVGERPRFHTPSRKVELYSYQLEQMGFDPVPQYTEPVSGGADEFRLITGRMSYHTHARTQHFSWLLSLHDNEVPVWVHTSRAKKLGLADGDRVRLVKGAKKSEPVPVKVTDHIHPEAVFIAHGFGHFSPQMKGSYKLGASSSDLSSADTDPISGASAFHNAFVTLEKA